MAIIFNTLLNKNIDNKRMALRPKKRGVPRIEVNLLVEIVLENQTRGISGKMINLCRAGACVILNKILPSSFVTLHINYTNNVHPIPVQAKVLWSNAIGNGQFYYGIIFLNLNDTHLAMLEKLMKYSIEKFSGIMLHSKFIEITQKLKDFLGQVQTFCGTFDKIKPSQSEQIFFIEKEKSRIFETINNYFYNLWEIAKNFSSLEYRNHQLYLQNQLLSFFMHETTVLNKRVYEKPLGYNGDYVVVNYIYEDSYSGNSTYGKLIDKYALSLSIARAHINRREYFYNIIMSIVQDRYILKDTRISSFACGPAREIIDVLEQDIDLRNVVFTCVDGELLALRQIHEELIGIQKKTNKEFNVNLIHGDVLNMVRKNNSEQLQNQDLIYCAGFLDYLSDRAATKVIEYLYSRLRDSGMLILVNISTDNPFRIYLEMLAEWYLHHRTPEQLIHLTYKITDARDIYIKSDVDTKKNLYLIIKR